MVRVYSNPVVLLDMMFSLYNGIVCIQEKGSKLKHSNCFYEPERLFVGLIRILSDCQSHMFDMR